MVQCSDRLVSISNRMIRNYRAGAGYKWVSCLCAARVVGKYDKGATAGLARELSLSVSQVENLARAGVVYRELRAHVWNMNQVRTTLTPSHFAVLGELMRKYEPPTWRAALALQDAAEAHFSVGDFKLALETEWGGYRAAWPGKVDKLMGVLDALRSDYDVPAGLKMRAAAAYKYFAAYKGG